MIVIEVIDIWSLDETVLPHIKAADAKWIVPEEAKEFILEIANG